MRTVTATEFGDLSVAEVTFRNRMLTGTVKLGEVCEWYGCSPSMGRLILGTHARRGREANSCEECGNPIVSFMAGSFGALVHVKRVDGEFVSTCPVG